jgi:hypothetical protein
LAAGGALASTWRGVDYGRERIMANRVAPNPHPILAMEGSRERRQSARKPSDKATRSRAYARSTLPQQSKIRNERSKCRGLRVVEMSDHLERPRERDATGDNVKLGLGFLAQIQIERGLAKR